MRKIISLTDLTDLTDLNDLTDLTDSIILLEIKQAAEKALLKNQFKVTY